MVRRAGSGHLEQLHSGRKAPLPRALGRVLRAVPVRGQGPEPRAAAAVPSLPLLAGERLQVADAVHACARSQAQRRSAPGVRSPGGHRRADRPGRGGRRHAARLRRHQRGDRAAAGALAARSQVDDQRPQQVHQEPDQRGQGAAQRGRGRGPCRGRGPAPVSRHELAQEGRDDRPRDRRLDQGREGLPPEHGGTRRDVPRVDAGPPRPDPPQRHDGQGRPAPRHGGRHVRLRDRRPAGALDHRRRAHQLRDRGHDRPAHARAPRRSRHARGARGGRQ